MAGFDFFQLLRLAAGFRGIDASRRKTAAGFRIDRRRDLALHRNPLDLLMDIAGGNGGQQRRGLGMVGLFENCLRLRSFHQLT